MAEAVTTTATGVLTLLGVDADPVQSREHILLSAILNDAWQQGRRPRSAAIIQRIQQPPFTRVGVLDLEAFYPEKDRFGLAMRLNGLLAAPGFALWLEGAAARHREHAAARPPASRAWRSSRLRISSDARAHVLRHAAAQSGGELDARAVGHVEPARAALHGRSRGLHAAGGESRRRSRRCCC